VSAVHCFDCGTGVRGSFGIHISTAKHQRAVATPVVRRKGPRRLRREAAWRMLSIEPSSLDDPAPTWKRCAGIPSLDEPEHFEPIEAFASNRAYPDGLYVRCRDHHRYYLAVWKARRELAAVAA
jgi:hypothetical protein